MSDMRRYKELNKEYKDLQKDRRCLQRATRISLKILKPPRQILKEEKDPEMREMAKEELSDLEPKRDRKYWKRKSRCC